MTDKPNRIFRACCVGIDWYDTLFAYLEQATKSLSSNGHTRTYYKLSGKLRQLILNLRKAKSREIIILDVLPGCAVAPCPSRYPCTRSASDPQTGGESQRSRQGVHAYVKTTKTRKTNGQYTDVSSIIPHRLFCSSISIRVLIKSNVASPMVDTNG